MQIAHMTLLSVVLSVGGALGQRRGHAADEAAIRDLMVRFMDAWNKHDAKAFAAVFAEHADFTNVLGVHARGRAQIEKFHAPVFATIFKKSHQSLDNISVRFLGPDIAAVDVHWEMTGAVKPDGSPWPLRKGLLNFIMMKKAQHWQILVMHNMDLPTL
jgi:uncharacterized protein (TIGR02246 family)